MTTKTKFIFFILITVLLVAPFLFAPKASAFMIDLISPASGSRGTKVTITGTGWYAGTENEIWMSESSNHMANGVLVATVPSTGDHLVFTIPNSLRGDKTKQVLWDIWVVYKYDKGLFTETRQFTLTPSAPTCTPSAGPWSSCSVSCGGGTQTRTITNSDCTTRNETQVCNTQACPPPPPPPPPTPTTILKTFSISPQTYYPGDTVSGSATLSVASPVTASFLIELYKDGQLFWNRDIDDIYLSAQNYTVPLETILGFTPTLPDNPSLFGSWEMKVIRKDISETLTQNFSIQQKTTTPISSLVDIAFFRFSPKVYTLGQTLTGQVSLQVPSATTASFRIELWKQGNIFWSRDINDVPLSAGLHEVPIETVFGFTPTIPMDRSFLGNYVMEIKISGSSLPYDGGADFDVYETIPVPPPPSPENQ